MFSLWIENGWMFLARRFSLYISATCLLFLIGFYNPLKFTEFYIFLWMSDEHLGKKFQLSLISHTDDNNNIKLKN